MTPKAERLVAITRELGELVPAFPGTPRGERFDKLQKEAIEISETLTPKEMEEVNNTLGIFFEA